MVYLNTASQMGKWAMAKELLSNHGLKIGPTEEELEGTIDLHPFDQDGLSALAIQVLARIKLARAEQTYIMKKQRVLAAEAKKEQDEIWELIKLMLVREKEQQGHSKANCKYNNVNFFSEIEFIIPFCFHLINNL